MIINVDDLWGKRILAETEGEAGQKAGVKTLTYGLEPRAMSPPPLFTCRSGASRRLSCSAAITCPSLPASWGGSTFPTSSPPPPPLSPWCPRRGNPGRDRDADPRPGASGKGQCGGRTRVFVDYAHTDDALRRVLENLSTFKTGRIITVFGCGGDRDRGNAAHG